MFPGWRSCITSSTIIAWNHPTSSPLKFHREDAGAPAVYPPPCWSPLKGDIPNKYPRNLSCMGLIIKGFPSQHFCHHLPYESSSLHQTHLRVKVREAVRIKWMVTAGLNTWNKWRTEAAATVQFKMQDAKNVWKKTNSHKWWLNSWWFTMVESEKHHLKHKSKNGWLISRKYWIET